MLFPSGLKRPPGEMAFLHELNIGPLPSTMQVLPFAAGVFGSVEL